MCRIGCLFGVFPVKNAHFLWTCFFCRVKILLQVLGVFKVVCILASASALLCVLVLFRETALCVCVCVCVARRDAYRLQMPFCIRTWRTDDCAITRVCVIAAIVLPAVARCLPMTRSHAILSRLNQTLSRNCHQCHESEVGF